MKVYAESFCRSMRTGNGYLRLPVQTAKALERHIMSKPRYKSTVATIPHAVELAKVIVANLPADAPCCDVREMTHVIIDAWLDGLCDDDITRVS